MSRLITIILIIAFGGDLSDTAKINKLKKQAEEAFQNEQFDKAIENYSYLLDSMGIDDEKAAMNLAHAYYQKGDKDLAQKRYQNLVLSKDPKIKSLAYQQLGALSNDPTMLEKALSHFKQSIKSDPANEDARYNYELIKKKLQNQQNQDQNQDQQNQDQEQNKDQQNQDQQQNQNQQNQDQENQDQQNQDQQDQQNKDQQNQEQQQQEQESKEEEGKEQEQQNQQGEQESKEDQQQQQEGEQQENGEEKDQQEAKPSTAQKLEEMNLSEEKAKMILEALKNSEVQYIQQNRRKPTQKQDNGKPDW